MGVLCMCFCFGMHYFVNLEEEEKVGCFAFIVIQMCCCYKCSVTLPHGAVGWSAVCGVWYFLLILTYFFIQQGR